MHEQSLVKALLKQVDTVRKQHGGERVTEVRVEVGPLSGVEPLLLANAFQELAVDSSLAEAKLAIDEVALLADCQSCGREFELEDFDFRCPACGNGLRVIRGDEFQLVSVSMQSSESQQELAS